jgi:hypothetical protein
MLARLGNVLFVVGCIIATPFVFMAYAEYFSDYAPLRVSNCIFFLVIGAIPVAIGWACRYVLRGSG